MNMPKMIKRIINARHSFEEDPLIWYSTNIESANENIMEIRKEVKFKW